MRSKIFITFLCIASVSILTTGCLSKTQEGAVIGAGAGTAAGTLVGAFTGNTAMGAVLGAGAGAAGGALVGDHLDKKREEQEKAEIYRQLELEKQKSTEGKNYIEGHYEYVKKRHWVDASKTEKVWVPERYEGERRIEGHYEERHVPFGHWQEYEEKIWIPEHYE